MLSVVDLVEAGTLTPDVAAYCIAAVSSGRSFLVGASPGGAGKTTVMGALLNFVPPDVALVAAGEPHDAARPCLICHEIGPGPYFGYLWGESLRRWFAAGADGAMLASNLHADTMAEVGNQIVAQNRVPEAFLRRIGLILFLEVTLDAHGCHRTISAAHESDGMHAHRLLWSRGKGWSSESGLVCADRRVWAAGLLERIADSGARTIQEVRAAFIKAIPA